MAGRKRFRDEQDSERRDTAEEQKRMKAESRSCGSSEVASCPRKTEWHRSSLLEGAEGDDSGSSAYSTEESEDADEDGVDGAGIRSASKPGRVWVHACRHGCYLGLLQGASQAHADTSDVALEGWGRYHFSF